MKLTRHLPTQLLLDQLNMLFVLFTMQPIREKLGVNNKTKGSLDRERIKKFATKAGALSPKLYGKAGWFLP